MSKGLLDINVQKKAVSNGHAPQAQKNEPRTLTSRHRVNAPEAANPTEFPTVCGRTGVNAPANMRGVRLGV